MTDKKKTAMEKNILQRHMGKDFENLSPLLQRFHSGKHTLLGNIEVENGKGLAWLVCRLMRFPRPGKAVVLRVECDHQDNHLIWNRYFGSYKMFSIFREKGEDLVESFNGLQLSVKAKAVNGEMHFNFHKTKYLGIPMPPILWPKVVAYEKEVNTKYYFFVDVQMLFLGKVIAYKGSLDVDP